MRRASSGSFSAGGSSRSSSSGSAVRARAAAWICSNAFSASGTVTGSSFSKGSISAARSAGMASSAQTSDWPSGSADRRAAGGLQKSTAVDGIKHRAIHGEGDCLGNGELSRWDNLILATCDETRTDRPGDGGRRHRPPLGRRVGNGYDEQNLGRISEKQGRPASAGCGNLLGSD